MRTSVKTIPAEEAFPPVDSGSWLVGFGRRLAEARGVAGLSQEELAAKIGKTNQAVAHYENGRNIPPTKTILDMEVALGVDLHWLLTGKRFETIVQAVVKVLAVDKSI